LYFPVTLLTVLMNLDDSQARQLVTGPAGLTANSSSIHEESRPTGIEYVARSARFVSTSVNNLFGQYS